MNPYLSRIRDYLIAKYRLRPGKAVAGSHVWTASRHAHRSGGKVNFRTGTTRYVLTYWEGEKTYLDFREEYVERKYKRRRRMSEEVSWIDQHLSANATGSIRRRYYHEGLELRSVRAISLKNFYNLPDEKLARLFFYTDEAHAWVEKLPFCYHPISNKQLAAMTSYEAYLAHFLGEGVAIPARLMAFLPPEEIHKLIQVVPGNYLGVLATFLKETPRLQKRQHSLFHLLLAHYKSVFDEPGNIAQIVKYYAVYCQRKGIKINLKIRSESRLRREHESLREESVLDRLPEELQTNESLILPKTQYGLLKFELIDQKRRLSREAEEMDSCVRAYAGEILDGDCALYRVTYRGRPYTLEIRKNYDGRLYINELLGARNHVPGGKLRLLVAEIVEQQPDARD